MGNGDESQLTKADFTQKLSKKAYKQIKKKQMERLYELESECFDRGIPVMIVFEGWDAAGKGTAIRLLTERLDRAGSRCWQRRRPAPTRSRSRGSGAFGWTFRAVAKWRFSTAVGMAGCLWSESRA